MFEWTYPARVNPNGTNQGRPLSTTDPYAVRTPENPPVYHVWVNLSNLANQSTQEYPGLVIGWRRSSDGYEAQVVYVIPGKVQRYSDSALVAWLPAHKLKPRD
ncbi:MAG: hypothetical protein JWQ91_1264 [Aeromicrobium sp.]|nr:hypothetical protein [Aeromicrobium sp.]MCW2824347.1 hypothetical protein [Aeromicrobium sp.]